MREKVIKAIEKEKIVVIVRGVESDKLIPLAKAMYDGGIRLLEITYSANGSVSDEDTAKNIKMLAKEFEGKMYIGAGGKFIISPDTNKEVIEETIKLGLVSMPGALTPSEIQSAHIYGADFVKLFPVSNFGIGYVKAVKAPLSHIKMLAVGGVDENNMADYLKAGISGFGIGTNIVNKKLIDEGKFDEITHLAKKYVANLN